jgi:hypothetical protein
VDTLLPDASVVSNSGFTGADGNVVFRTLASQSGEYTSTVTEVHKDGWEYDAAANVETSEILLVP